MDASTIKFKTVQLINGVSYLAPKQIEGLKCIVPHNLKIEKTDETDSLIEESIKSYFEIQNSVRFS